MAFLNSEIASTLQYFTLPLEIIGIALATVEVRYERVAQRINKILEFQVSRWTDAKKELKTRHPFVYKIHGGDSGLHMPVPYSMYVLLTVMLALVAVAAFIAFALFVVDQTGTLSSETISVIRDASRMMLFYLVVPLSGVLIVGLGIVFVAVKFVHNRAVGTLGIIIASFGLLGEVYQLVTQLVLGSN